MFKGGGVQECVLELKKELKTRGHAVQIITPRPRSVPAGYDRDIILVGVATDVKSPFHTTAQVSATLDSASLDAILAAHKFDVIHFHEPWVPLMSWQLLSRSKEAAHVATFHAKLPETVMSRTIERVITPYTKAILKSLGELTAVSDAASEYVTSLTNKRPVIIPNGIDLDKYRPSAGKSKPTTEHTILYIGRLEKRKGVKYLIQAYALVAKNDPNVQLQIIGDGSDKAKLVDYVKNKKIPRVKFRGYVSEQEKIAAIQNAAVFCSPALFGESFGIVLLEAMAMGTVVLAGNNPGYLGVLKEQADLSIIDPKETKAFAARLNRLIYDEELREDWQRWAAEHVKQFNYSRITDMYEHVYTKALKKPLKNR